jgi:hypothetical protein
MKQTPTSATSLTLQIHHFSKDKNNELISKIVNPDIQKLIVLTIFININNFILNPIKESAIKTNDYNELYNRTLDILIDLYDNHIVDNINENDIDNYFNILINSFDRKNNNNNFDITFIDKSTVMLIYEHLIKDFQYYSLMNKYLAGSLDRTIIMFMPIFLLVRQYFSNNNYDYSIYYIDRKMNMLLSIKNIDLLVEELKKQTANDLNMIKNLNTTYTPFIDKVIGKISGNTINQYLVSDFNIRRIMVLTDYVFCIYLKNTIQSKDMLSDYENALMNKLSYMTNILTANNFPVIMNNRNKNTYIDLIVNLISQSDYVIYTKILDNNITNYSRISNVFNKKLNKIYPYIFRNGNIEEFSPKLRNIAATFFMLYAFLCLKIEVLKNNNKFLIVLLNEYIKNVKTYIVNIYEIKQILGIN